MEIDGVAVSIQEGSEWKGKEGSPRGWVSTNATSCW